MFCCAVHLHCSIPAWCGHGVSTAASSVSGMGSLLVPWSIIAASLGSLCNAAANVACLVLDVGGVPVAAKRDLR
jgi:hypothetical protein